MRTLERNMQNFHYALYVSDEPIIDEYGNDTGQSEITYSAPVSMKANISAARGTSDVEQFGIAANYTKTIVTADMSCPIDESAILWIGVEPDADGEVGAIKHNYVVAQVARSINGITYAVRGVEVS